MFYKYVNMLGIFYEVFEALFAQWYFQTKSSLSVESAMVTQIGYVIRFLTTGTCNKYKPECWLLQGFRGQMSNNYLDLKKRVKMYHV